MSFLFRKKSLHLLYLQYAFQNKKKTLQTRNNRCKKNSLLIKINYGW